MNPTAAAAVFNFKPSVGIKIKIDFLFQILNFQIEPLNLCPAIKIINFVYNY